MYKKIAFSLQGKKVHTSQTYQAIFLEKARKNQITYHQC